MKEKKLFFILVAIYFCHMNLNLSGQNNTSVNENIILLTDRDLYISNEKIWFNAYCMMNNKFTQETFSKVMYFELFNSEKNSVVKKKVKIINGRSSSYIEIPADIETGSYNLTAYTQYMKNFINIETNTISLIIINPDIKGETKLTDSENSENNESKKLNKLVINPDKRSYYTREKVIVSISDKTIPETLKYITVSVNKKGSLNNTQISNLNFDGKPKDIDIQNIKHYPEIRDLTISGTLKDKNSGEILPEEKLYLSVISGYSQFDITKTDTNGKFIFTLNSLYNDQDILISTDNKEQDIEIITDNSFINNINNFKAPNYHLDSSKIELINEMYLNSQLTNYFPDKSELLKTNSDTTVNFFGPAEISINIDDFIKLPTLHEVFDEIVPSVNVRKKKEDYYFQVYNMKNNRFFKDPLVFYDQFLILNINNLLKVKPKYINKIDIINREYIIGNYIFNGIIFIESKTGKIPGIDLPKNSIITNFQTIHESTEINFPVYEDSNRINSKLPDFRNLLYWNSNAALKDNLKLEFYTSDHSSEYDIIVRGITESGELFYGKTTLLVRKRD